MLYMELNMHIEANVWPSERAKLLTLPLFPVGRSGHSTPHGGPSDCAHVRLNGLTNLHVCNSHEFYPACLRARDYIANCEIYCPNV